MTGEIQMRDNTTVMIEAATAIRDAEVIIITAGAGMGVDSGLPDFRGSEGFWQAYPPYAARGLSFVDCANPDHFATDPGFGWGFYGHRLHQYRETTPHAGFATLLQWCQKSGRASWVVTSNVDGQFQKAGFPEEQLLEIHGSIHWLQCSIPCGRAIWENTEAIPVAMSTMRARTIPRCPRCGVVSRPNILMFGDWGWIGDRTEQQQQRWNTFLEEQYGKRTVVIELGAGTAVPSIRSLSERLGRRPETTVVRINLREPEIIPPHLSLRAGAADALKHLECLVASQ